MGGLGIWGQWEGSVPTGGAVLLGTNFAPTNFLWCAFGMDGAVYTTVRGPWRWTRAAYLNASAIACEVRVPHELPSMASPHPMCTCNWKCICMYAYTPEYIYTPTRAPVDGLTSSHMHMQLEMHMHVCIYSGVHIHTT